MREIDLNLYNSWVEISEKSLANNIQAFRTIAGNGRKLMIIVKSNAYGHGLIEISSIAKEKGVDWFGVFTFHEALKLRNAGIVQPILVMGPTPKNAIKVATENEIHLTVASKQSAMDLLSLKVPVKIHLKLETGTNRQGLLGEDISIIKQLSQASWVQIEGAYTHFADIEDTTDHSYAERQLEKFKTVLQELAENEITPEIRHTACTAASLLFPQTFFDMIRVGIGTYGLWPSKETYVSAHQLGREIVKLLPVMTWKTRISQIKNVRSGEYIGYGRTFRMTRAGQIAVLPVGYANGYDRSLSNQAHVLIKGKRAPLLGRVCMNLCMVDVTDIPDAQTGDEVVLLGIQENEEITAETMAGWMRTINYEVVTHVEPENPRVLV